MSFEYHTVAVITKCTRMTGTVYELIQREWWKKQIQILSFYNSDRAPSQWTKNQLINLWKKKWSIIFPLSPCYKHIHKNKNYDSNRAPQRNLITLRSKSHIEVSIYLMIMMWCVRDDNTYTSIHTTYISHIYMKKIWKTFPVCEIIVCYNSCRITLSIDCPWHWWGQNTQ